MKVNTIWPLIGVSRGQGKEHVASAILKARETSKINSLSLGGSTWRPFSMAGMLGANSFGTSPVRIDILYAKLSSSYRWARGVFGQTKLTFNFRYCFTRGGMLHRKFYLRKYSAPCNRAPSIFKLLDLCKAWNNIQ